MHVVYSNVPSAIKPVPHNDEIPIPNPSSDIDSSLCTSSDEDIIECNEIYQPIEVKIEPQLFDQADQNDLIRDLGLSKESSQLLGSRLKEKHLLSKTMKFAWYRHRDAKFRKYFLAEEELVYCCNIVGLINEMGIEYDPTEWRLFIDSSMRILKVVVLHNGNQPIGSIPIGYSIAMNGTYANMKIVLDKIGYYQQNWKMCGDLKVLKVLNIYFILY